MCKQTGARYLHKRRNRTDHTFNGLIKLTTRTSNIVQLSSGAVKRIKKQLV